LLFSRILTAIALLAGFLAAILLLDRNEFAVLVIVIMGIAAWEWARLCRFSSRGSILYATGFALAFAASSALIWPISAAESPERVIFGLAAVFWICIVPPWLRRGVARQAAGAGAALLPFTGVAVIAPAGLAMLALPGVQLLGILVLIWIADTAAYFSGRLFGRHKLAPGISPGKTWEGVAGAMLACAGYAVLVAVSYVELAARIDDLRWPPYIGAALLLCALSVLGDLFESALKRQAAVKDSGSLLPGHGGVLDRIDSTTSTLPVAVLLLDWVGVK